MVGGAGTVSPTVPDLTMLIHTLAVRICRFLERQGLLERNTEYGYLVTDTVDEGPMQNWPGHSITCSHAECVCNQMIVIRRRRYFRLRYYYA